MSQALWHISATKSELRAVDPPSDPNLIAIDSLYSMISTGSERLVASGRAGRADDAIDAPYAVGDFGFPIKYGYSLVARDDAGKIVHCLHPHQSVAYVHKQVLHRLPDSVDQRRFALLSNMETVLNAIWDTRLDEGQDVMICGFGNIGALLANTLRIQNGIEPVVVEIDAWRREKARSLGFEAFTPGQVSGVFARVINSSSSSRGLQFCIDHCAMNGIIVELSWYGLERVNLELGSAFHRNRVRIVSSQVSTIPAHVSDTATIESRIDRAGDLLSEPSFDDLISNEISFSDSPVFFDDLRQGRQGNGLIWLIKY